MIFVCVKLDEGIVYSPSRPAFVVTFIISLYEIPSPIFLHSFITGHNFDPLSKFDKVFSESLPDLFNEFGNRHEFVLTIYLVLNELPFVTFPRAYVILDKIDVIFI